MAKVICSLDWLFTSYAFDRCIGFQFVSNLIYSNITTRMKNAQTNQAQL
jgi:hypothetical protein